MAIYRHSEGLPPEARGAVVAVGNFDGVHLGHQAVIAAAREEADRLGTALNLLTFEPHPRQVFQPDLPPFRLTPLRIKARALEAAGVDNMIVLHFDLAFSKRSAEAFVGEVLLRDLGARHVVTGWDFRFGHKRGGDVALLETLGAERGFGTTAVAPVAAPGGEVFASSRIRALSQGRGAGPGGGPARPALGDRGPGRPRPRPGPDPRLPDRQHRPRRLPLAGPRHLRRSGPGSTPAARPSSTTASATSARSR